MNVALEWFRAETLGAPPRLTERAERFLAEAAADSIGERLATAAQRALDASIAGGDRREAAIDLLAADALITLALLEVARNRPDRLSNEAHTLRTAALVPA